MSCANPWQQYHVWRDFFFRPYNVPCGWCLNCRKDKQNYYADRAKYELCTRLSAAFVTFTYDDFHLYTECLPDVPIKAIMPNGLPYTTCRHKHIQQYIDSLRHYIHDHGELHNVLCQPDFSYMYVMEYGDVFERPHCHILFFGLDFAYCKKLLLERWNKGFIDVRPVLDGAIGYVTKYMDKQVFGVLAEEQFDSKGLERPKIRMSKGFGKGLLLSRLKEIKENNYTYQVGRVRRPISAYWKRLIHGNNIKSFSDKIKARIDGYERSAYEMQHTYRLQNCSRRKVDEFRLQQARIREDKLREMIRADGRAAIDYRYVHTYMGDKLKYRSEFFRLPVDVQRGASSLYIDSLIKELNL